MITNLSNIMTLANGIIGVSVLAMPFCFKQCGIILGILMLLLSSSLSKFACHLLVKSAVMSRRRNFELLAFHAFGRTGKFFAELFIIGFLMGTCIAFFVVVGDLGPEIVGKMIDKRPEDIRTSLLVTIGIFVILPLGLLRNVDSLSSICTATIGFYLCLVLKVMTESLNHIFATDWYDKVFYWRPSGILQCLPIFSMALFCQTQLFEIYETIPNVCLEKMNQVVRAALNICTTVYVCVGFFGYVAFCTLPFTGNILMSFEPSLSSEAIKIGFVLSVAFSFPLVIFPCRASLNSLLFRWVHSHETSSNYIPETRFRWLTFLIVAVSLITGILIPNIEFVLGLVGSTIGVMICLMFPAAFFISISSKNTNERLLAQAMLFIGVWIMILCTYANLYAMEESANAKLTVTTGNSISQLNNVPIQAINVGDIQVVPPIPKINELPIIDETKFKPLEVEKIHEDQNSKDDVRQEPPIPVERAIVTEKTILVIKKSESHPNPTLLPIIEEKDRNIEVKEEVVVLKAEKKIKEIEMSEHKNAAIQKTDNLINSDAIKKEELELAADADRDFAAEAEHDKKHEELRKTLEKHEIEQRQMLQEQKEIINTLKQQKQELEKEKKEKKKEATKKAGKKTDRDDRDTGIDEKVDADKNKVNGNEGDDVKLKAKKDDTENLKKSSQVVANELKDIETGKQEIKAKIDDAKVNRDPSIVDLDKDQIPKKSRGPILSALVKQALNSTNPNVINTNSVLKSNRKNEPDIAIVKDTGANPSNNNSVHILGNNNSRVPIALIMRENSKKDIVDPISSKKIDEKLAIRRDILENEERKKRDVNELTDDFKGENVDSFVSDVADGESKEKCANTDQSLNNLNKTTRKEKENERSIKEKMTTELFLIKTNSYLSDQSHVNGNPLDKSFNLKRGFEKSNHGDLKPISSKNSNSK